MMDEKPVIGVTPLWDDERKSIWMLPGYMDMIAACGGLPIILPLNADKADVVDLAKRCDGILFTGGHDLAPACYEEKRTSKCGPACEVRDRMEIYLLQYALFADVPCLGICRGTQLMNAALGGTLYQDIPSQLPQAVSHKMSPPYSRPWHGLSVVPNSPLHRLLRHRELKVNSYHHQAIKDVSFQLSPMAYSPDGLVEAVFYPGKTFVWGVQWHPELSWEVDTDQRAIAQAFVDACG